MVKYQIAFSCDTGALVPAVADVTSSLNECLRGFGCPERIAVRSQVATMSFQTEVALTEAQKAGMGAIILKHLSAQVPQYRLQMESFSIIG